MAQITAALVKDLRDRTGAGMMDAKKALVENDGDMEAAIDWLRAKGLSKAAKKSGRTAADGLVAAVLSDDGKTGALVELNAETDFVARNEKFQTALRQIADTKPHQREIRPVQRGLDKAGADSVGGFELVMDIHVQNRALAVAALHLRQAVDAVQIVEMGTVDDVLLNFVPDGGHRPGMAVVPGPLAVLALVDYRQRVFRCLSPWVPPGEEQAVTLHQRQ